MQDEDYDYYHDYDQGTWQGQIIDTNRLYRISGQEMSSGLELLDNGDGTYTVLGIGTCTDSFIAIPNNVSAIAAEAFKYTNISRVKLGSGVKTIGDNAFYNCDSLASVTLNEGLTSIGNNAFFDDGKLQSIEIPSSVLTIGSNAFMRSAITEVTFAEGAKVTSFGAYAFANCKFAAFDIPASVEEIGQQCFDTCDQLKSINLKNAQIVGYKCFQSCTRLESIVIGHEIDKIGNLVGDAGFSTCSSLNKIYYEGTETEWNAISLNQDKDVLEAKGLYFYSESQPVGAGNYWHFVNDVPTVW